MFVFFEQFGEIIEVKLARNYFGTLLTHKTQAKYERKFNYLKRIVYYLYNIQNFFFIYSQKSKERIMLQS